jgi:hypothetical protein
VPAAANRAGPPLPESFGQQGGQFGFPVAHRFVGEDEATDQEHLGQVTQAQLVAEPKEHHEKDDISGELNMVEHRTGPLVVPTPTILAPEPPAALDRPARPLGR